MIERVAVIVLVGFAVAAVFMALGNRRATHATASRRWLKFVVYFAIVVLILGAAAMGRVWVFLILCLIIAMVIREYAAVVDRLPGWTSYLFALVLVLMAWQGWRLGAPGVMFVFLPVAAADGFAQVVGQWVGRRQLAAEISPSKTVEGTYGGVLAGVTVAILVRNLCGLDIAWAAAIGLCAAVAGSGGDLAASWIKRRAGIKDFSNALPEHGGFLDRFDSLIMALALAGPLLPYGS